MTRLLFGAVLGAVLGHDHATIALGAKAVDPKQKADTAQVKKDVEAVRQYLRKSFPGKKWQSGPTKVDSKEIRQALGAGRYYYVHSALPLPPGARIQSAIDAYQKKVKDIRENHVSLAVRIDEAGKITSFKTAKDFARALKPVKSEEEAKTTAAAVLSLFGSDRVGPGPIPLDKVTVRKTANGYLCTARPNRFSAGSASFDKNGVLVGLSKQYLGPFPP